MSQQKNFKRLENIKSRTMCQPCQGLVTQIDSSGVRSFSQALALTSELSLDESLDTKVMYKLCLGLKPPQLSSARAILLMTSPLKNELLEMQMITSQKL